MSRAGSGEWIPQAGAFPPRLNTSIYPHGYKVSTLGGIWKGHSGTRRRRKAEASQPCPALARTDRRAGAGTGSGRGLQRSHAAPDGRTRSYQRHHGRSGGGSHSHARGRFRSQGIALRTAGGRRASGRPSHLHQVSADVPDVGDATMHAHSMKHFRHEHVFLGSGHDRNERRSWIVIGICGAMMVAEIGGGALFGSMALIADGLHMSTHAGALFIAALAYTYARRHAHDERFTFGTGKLGDLAAFTSAIVLAMIALLIGYESINRLFHPVHIAFNQAIPIAFLGLGVNL